MINKNDSVLLISSLRVMQKTVSHTHEHSEPEVTHTQVKRKVCLCFAVTTGVFVAVLLASSSVTLSLLTVMIFRCAFFGSGDCLAWRLHPWWLSSWIFLGDQIAVKQVVLQDSWFFNASACRQAAAPAFTARLERLFLKQRTQKENQRCWIYPLHRWIHSSSVELHEQCASV